jgi:hypothetical protein
MVRRLATVPVVFLLWTAFTAASPPLPESEAFLRRARQSIKLDPELQQSFTYIEERRDIKISRLGKVVVGPLRTFEVYPSDEPGQTYKRLIAVEGKPLDPAELAKRDAEHQQDVEQRARKRVSETPAERAAREAEAAAERRERDAWLADALAVFEPTILGRDAIDHESVIVVGLAPRADAPVRTREGSWMKQFEGRAWFTEADAQLVRLDVRAMRDVTIGWGIIGRIHEGSRLLFSRRKFHDAWLPSELLYQASGRTLLFRPFTLNVVTTYSNYRRRETPP